MRQTALRLVGVFCVVSAASGCVIDVTPSDSVTGSQTVEDTGVGDVDGTDATDGTGVEVDATAGTGGELNCALPYPCKTEGICDGIVPTCKALDDGSFAWNCNHPDGYVENEGVDDCNGIDDDCDGATDDIADQDSDPVNCTEGVCANAPSRCLNGGWVCQPPPKDPNNPDGYLYESPEVSCDGLDNDCDGQTDVGVVGTAATCGLTGVCRALGTVNCVGGEWDCNPNNYPVQLPFYEPDITCDGLDNNCDGDTDELANPTESGCPNVGPCLSTVVSSCEAGQWLCGYSAVPDYEATEISCDGIDNDCDGTTDQNLVGLSATNCSSAKLGVGVCANGPTPICANAITSCIFDNIEGFEPEELTCDGLDNDCDGETDETLTPPPGECPTSGACASGLIATCTGVGTWNCSFGGADWEPGDETRCDGIDNDCDGATDEDIIDGGAPCLNSGSGVCKGEPVTSVCQNGIFACSYDNVTNYEASEQSCDGLDNDCDGQTDEELTSIIASSCKKVGVCSELTKVQATCKTGNWECDYDLLLPVGYQPTETLCDGKDNDCDGLIDEGISVPGGDVCPPGVCSQSGSAVCIDGEFKCDIANIIGYENPEVSCDGIDNDCDGSTDEGTCGVGDTCSDSDVCASGLCHNDPGGTVSCCVSGEGRCPTAGCGGEVTIGSVTCVELADESATSWYTPECGGAGWLLDTDDDKCPVPACLDGQCLQCFPDSVTCTENNLSVQICDSDGTLDSATLCGGATTCKFPFPGICLRHADQKVDTGQPGDSALGASVMQITADELIVTWHQESGGQFVAISQHVGTDGALEAKQIIPQGGAAISASSVATARLDNARTAYVWQQPASETAQDISLRVMNHTSGAAITSSIIRVNQEVGKEHRQPRVATASFGASPRIMVVWDALTANGNGYDVYARSYALNGNNPQSNTAEDDFRVNVLIEGPQQRPVITTLTDKTMIVGWESQDQSELGNTTLYGRKIEPSSNGTLVEKLGSPFVLHSTVSGEHVDLEIAALADGGFVATWSRDVNGLGAIYLRTYDADGTARGDEILVNDSDGATVVDDRQHPHVVQGSLGSIVVAWDDTGGDDGRSVWLRQYRSNLVPVSSAVRINETVQLGDQTHPRLAAPLVSPEWVLVTYIDDAGNGKAPEEPIDTPLAPAVYIRPMVLLE